MAYYDIGEVFQKIEEDMIASMARNLKRHLNTEKEEGINYAMWQSEQLAALNEFKRNNKSLFGRYFSTINEQIEEVLKKAHESGKMDQEAQILEAIMEGWSTALKPSGTIQGAFFRINDRKLKALINSVTNDMKKAETAMLRRANDEYRKILFNSQAYYNTGAGTLPQCVDMATKDFLSRGISCIEYANGARVGIDSYARMAIRTAQTRAYLLGESAKRDEWGISTVIVNKRGVACPKCLQYVGRVFYDDVWGSAPIPSPEKYPRLSEAIAGGLYHPNCKDIHTTYFEGISEPPEPMTEREKKEASRVYNLEQQQRYNERQIRKYKRLSAGSLDPENRGRYYKKLSEWQHTQRKFVKANGDVLRRRYENESIHGIGPIDNADTRRAVEDMRREVTLEKIKALRRNNLTNAGNSDIMQSRNFDNRNMSSGNRRSAYHILTDDEITSIKDDAKALNIPQDILRFNEGYNTGFSERYMSITVRGDVLPDLDSTYLRDRLSPRAVLAHEYYGHYKQHPSKFRVGDWRDEFRASYRAAIDAPGLSDEERITLMLDAYDRAKEAGVNVKYNRKARELIYGKNE